MSNTDNTQNTNNMPKGDINRHIVTLLHCCIAALRNFTYVCEMVKEVYILLYIL